MAIIGEDLLKLNIKEKNFSPVYLIYGEEDYTKKYYYGLLVDKIIGDGIKDLNFHYIDNPSVSLNEIGIMSEALPVMGDRTCIVVNDLKVEELSDSDVEYLEDLFKDFNDSCVLIFYMQTHIPKFSKSNARKFKKIVNDKGSIINFARKDERQLAKLAISAAKKRGCSFPQYLATEFIAQVGNDLNLVRNEVEKLCAFVGSGEIKKEDIKAVCVKTLDASIFDLTKALVKGDADKVFEIWQEIMQMNSEPNMMLGAIASAYIDMYRVKVATENGLSPSAVADLFGYGKLAWKLKNASYTAKNLTTLQMRDCIDALSNADDLLKSSQNDDRIIMEETLVKLMRISLRG